MKVEIARSAEPLFARQSDFPFVVAPSPLNQRRAVAHQQYGGRSLLDLPWRHHSDFKLPFSFQRIDLVRGSHGDAACRLEALSILLDYRNGGRAGMKYASVLPLVCRAFPLQEEFSDVAEPFVGNQHSSDRLRFGSVIDPGTPSRAQGRFRASMTAVIRILTMGRGSAISEDLPFRWLSRLSLLRQSSALVIVTSITRWVRRLTPAGRASGTEELEAWGGAIASFRHSRATRQVRS